MMNQAYLELSIHVMNQAYLERADIQEFITAVAEMRSQQREYFKDRTIDNLRKAKDAEYLVDKAIQEFTSHKQTSLF